MIPTRTAQRANDVNASMPFAMPVLCRPNIGVQSRTFDPEHSLRLRCDITPAILPDEAYDLWLDPGFQKTDAVCDLLKPFNPVLMRRYEVSNRVNLVKNDDAACAEAV
jgi:hypothetical protein